MNRFISVVTSFHSDAHKEKINAAAEKLGFSVRYFASDAEAESSIHESEILFSHSSPDLLKKAENLKWFCCDFAGVDKYQDPAVFCREDCLLTNSSGAYGIAIAEHLIMVSLMLTHRYFDYQPCVTDGRWGTDDIPIRSIIGSTITVLGTGDIGTEFARRAKALGAKCVRGVHRSNSPIDAAFDENHTQAQLDSLLPDTDLLIMCLPSTPDTVGILSRERIAMLPRHACVCNVGRGTAIDQEALMEALHEGRIAGAALDVVVPEPIPDGHPLLKTPNLIITPHCAGNMALDYTCHKVVDMFLEDLAHYAAGEKLTYLVNRKVGY